MNYSLHLAIMVITLIGSTQTFAKPGGLPTSQVSLSGGPYAPLVSSSNEEQRDHYDLYYGDSSEYIFGNRPILTTLEFTNYIWNGSGMLGITTGFGLWTIAGSARRCLAPPTEEDATEELFSDCVPGDMSNSVEGSTETQFKIAPLHLGLTYRSNHLHQQFGIPVDFYVKGGLDYYLWSSTTGGQTALIPTEEGESEEGSGGTPGYHLGAGIAFNLDWIDPQRPSYSQSGYQLAGSYLFMEVNKISVDGFGDESRLDMSSTHFSTGISIDFL